MRRMFAHVPRSFCVFLRISCTFYLHLARIYPRSFIFRVSCAFFALLHTCAFLRIRAQVSYLCTHLLYSPCASSRFLCGCGLCFAVLCLRISAYFSDLAVFRIHTHPSKSRKRDANNGKGCTFVRFFFHAHLCAVLCSFKISRFAYYCVFPSGPERTGPRRTWPGRCVGGVYNCAEKIFGQCVQF